MKKQEIELLYSYFYNNLCRLENTVRQLQFNIRYRDFDSADLLELLEARQELDTFREVTRHIILLLDLKHPDIRG